MLKKIFFLNILTTSSPSGVHKIPKARMTEMSDENIKSNDGSHTTGMDGRIIELLTALPEEKFVKLIQKQFGRYKPKAVRRVETPRPNGKLGALGIPRSMDRVIQQCILQAREPICEAKFLKLIQIINAMRRAPIETPSGGNYFPSKGSAAGWYSFPTVERPVMPANQMRGL